MWHKLALNFEAITSLYSVGPSLENIELLKFGLDRDDPSAFMVLDLRDFPDSPSKRWHPDFNSIALHLRFIGVTSFRFEGINHTMLVNALISKCPTGELMIQVNGETYA